MENQILDNFEEYSESKYAKQSFRNFFFSFCLYALLVFINTKIENLNDYHSIFTLILMLIALILNCTGLIYGIKSIRRKEKSVFKKWFGVLANFIFMLVIFLIVFASAVDVYVAFTK